MFLLHLAQTHRWKKAFFSPCILYPAQRSKESFFNLLLFSCYFSLSRSKLFSAKELVCEDFPICFSGVPSLIIIYDPIRSYFYLFTSGLGNLKAWSSDHCQGPIWQFVITCIFLCPTATQWTSTHFACSQELTQLKNELKFYLLQNIYFLTWKLTNRIGLHC